jgi:hypothetical protein
LRAAHPREGLSLVSLLKPAAQPLAPTKHQVFLVTYLSVGIALAVNFATALQAGEIVLSEDGAREFPFLTAFFVISGFRARFSIPGRTRFQLALPHYRSAMGGNLAQRHS